MNLIPNIHRLKEEIYWLSEGYGSVARAIQIAKDRFVNRNYHIPDHMWPDVEEEIKEEIEKYRLD